jgi:hypothetical protein
MNVSSYVQDISFSSLPLIVWQYYLEYLWYYDSSSWVAKIASTIRVLAFLLILPVAILGMLDISSYVIARTLGVVDVAKASTTDKPLMPRLTIPSIHVEDTSSPSPCHTDSVVSVTDESIATSPDISDTADEESNGFAELSALDQSLFSNEKLSGVGVFSPATSRPPSPTLSRRKLIRLGESKSLGGEMNVLEDQGLSLRRRPRRNTRSGVQD